MLEKKARSPRRTARALKVRSRASKQPGEKGKLTCCTDVEQKLRSEVRRAQDKVLRARARKKYLLAGWREWRRGSESSRARAGSSTLVPCLEDRRRFATPGWPPTRATEIFELGPGVDGSPLEQCHGLCGVSSGSLFARSAPGTAGRARGEEGKRMKGEESTAQRNRKNPSFSLPSTGARATQESEKESRSDRHPLLPVLQLDSIAGHRSFYLYSYSQCLPHSSTRPSRSSRACPRFVVCADRQRARMTRRVQPLDH